MGLLPLLWWHLSGNLPGNKQNVGVEVIDAIMATKIGLLNWDLPQVHALRIGATQHLTAICLYGACAFSALVLGDGASGGASQDHNRGAHSESTKMEIRKRFSEIIALDHINF